MPDAPLTVATTQLLFDLLTPRAEGQVSDTDADAAAQEVLDEMEREEAWEAAQDPAQGYQGERGRTPDGAVRTPPPLTGAPSRPPPDVWPVWQTTYACGPWTLTPATPAIPPVFSHDH